MHKLIDLPGGLRVESGPLRKRDVASEALLSDRVTAVHYKAGAVDAMSKPIAIGEEMDYIDWLNRNEKAWNLYREEEGRFAIKGVFATEQEALTAAFNLAKEV